MIRWAEVTFNTKLLLTFVYFPAVPEVLVPDEGPAVLRHGVCQRRRGERMLLETMNISYQNFTEAAAQRVSCSEPMKSTADV